MFRKKFSTLALLACVTAICLASVGSAALVSMTGDDTIGTSSFNAAGKWSNLAAPSAGNDYQNANFLLRTPGVNGDFTFAGDSLLITSDVAAAVNLNDSLLFKGVGAGNDITANNLTFNGGSLRNASGNADFFYLNGNILTVGPNGMGVHVQGPLFINSPVAGSGLIKIVDPGSSDLARTLHFANGANTYTGSIQLVTANRSRFSLDSTGNMNFVIGAPGVNNSINGAGNAVLDGVFNLDLSGASTTLGDSWTLVSTTSKTFGATFSIPGFMETANVWSNGDYMFDEATGVLTAIPEPASLVLLGLCGLAQLIRRR